MRPDVAGFDWISLKAQQLPETCNTTVSLHEQAGEDESVKHRHTYLHLHLQLMPGLALIRGHDPHGMAPMALNQRIKRRNF